MAGVATIRADEALRERPDAFATVFAVGHELEGRRLEGVRLYTAREIAHGREDDLRLNLVFEQLSGMGKNVLLLKQQCLSLGVSVFVLEGSGGTHSRNISLLLRFVLIILEFIPPLRKLSNLSAAPVHLALEGVDRLSALLENISEVNLGLLVYDHVGVVVPDWCRLKRILWRLRPGGKVVLDKHARVEHGEVAVDFGNLHVEQLDCVLVAGVFQGRAERPEAVDLGDAGLVEVLQGLFASARAPARAGGRPYIDDFGQVFVEVSPLVPVRDLDLEQVRVLCAVSRRARAHAVRRAYLDVIHFHELGLVRALGLAAGSVLVQLLALLLDLLALGVVGQLRLLEVGEHAVALGLQLEREQLVALAVVVVAAGDVFDHVGHLRAQRVRERVVLGRDRLGRRQDGGPGGERGPGRALAGGGAAGRARGGAAYDSSDPGVSCGESPTVSDALFFDFLSW